MPDRLQQQLDFIIEIDRLKQVIRQTSIASGERRENTAEHSWHAALAAALLAEYGDEPLDQLHVLKMLLIHDIVEIDAGDTFGYDVRGHQDKALREQQAADRIFGLLPADQRQAYRALWDEFEAQATPEAHFALAMDRLMPLLHNYLSGGSAWKRHGITQEQVYQRMQPIMKVSPRLGARVETIIEECAAKGFFGPS
jgi:putative hydrolase of HD superfamily